MTPRRPIELRAGMEILVDGHSAVVKESPTRNGWGYDVPVRFTSDSTDGTVWFDYASLVEVVR